MTAKSKMKVPRVAGMSFGAFFFCFMSIFSLAMIIKNSEIAIEYMQTGLRLCATNVIPSLFPFMVISELLVSSGFGEVFGKTLGMSFRRLFAISRAGSSAVLLGAVCGFPVGAKTAVSLYDRGTITREELERLLTFCNIPSSGFLISAVGISLFSSRQFGIFLYCTAMVAAFLSGIIGRMLCRSRASDEIPTVSLQVDRIGVSTFTTAVSSATASMLSVCSYVIFFSSVIGCLSHALGTLSLPAHLEALLFGVFEISSGVSAASMVGSTPTAAAICGFIIGWSGISVHFQIMSLCGNRGISFFPYFISKLCQGILCGVSAWGYVKFLAPDMLSGAQSTGVIRPDGVRLRYTLVICLIFLLCIIWRYGRRKRFGQKSNNKPQSQSIDKRPPM